MRKVKVKIIKTRENLIEKKEKIESENDTNKRKVKVKN